MFLHLGNDVSVRTRDIIAIYDYVGFFVKDNPDNKRYFARCKAEGKVWRTTASMDLVKSIVITRTGSTCPASPHSPSRTARARFTIWVSND